MPILGTLFFSNNVEEFNLSVSDITSIQGVSISRPGLGCTAQLPTVPCHLLKIYPIYYMKTARLAGTLDSVYDVLSLTGV